MSLCRTALMATSTLVALVAVGPGGAAADQPRPAARSVAPAGVTTTLYQLVRRSPAPSRLTVSVLAAFDDSPTTIAAVPLRDTASGPVVVAGAYSASNEGTGELVVYGQADRVGCSAAPATCPGRNAGADVAVLVQRDEGVKEPDAATRVLLAVRAVQGNVEVDDPGDVWDLERVSPSTAAVRLVRSSDSPGAAGAYQTNGGVEVFTRAAAPGGARGSVALGAPPCTGLVAAGAGVGVVTLTGGTSPVTVTCPLDTAPAAAVSRGATSWTLSGTAAGLTSLPSGGNGLVRLVVVDLPPLPCPAPAGVEATACTARR